MKRDQQAGTAERCPARTPGDGSPTNPLPSGMETYPESYQLLHADRRHLTHGVLAAKVVVLI